jgi:hypothetical protein
MKLDSLFNPSSLPLTLWFSSIILDCSPSFDKNPYT